MSVGRTCATRLTSVGRVLRQVAQRAEDLARAEAFYRDVVGLRHIATFDPPGLAFFELGSTRLLIEKGATSALLYLGLGDVFAARQRLVDAGVEFVDEPHVIFRDADGTFGPAGEEEWMSFFHDSEGNLVGLVERRPMSS
jgi:methylmalonyl-CoA/ethylmalonyl-CoA epimerase